MKNLFITLSLSIGSLSIFGQSNFNNWTFYGSISPKQSPVAPNIFVNRDTPIDEFRFNLNNVSAETSIGIRRNFKFNPPFFGTLGAEYSEKRETFSMLFTYPNEPSRKLYYDLQTTRKTVTIPVGVGVHIGKLDVMSGLKAQYTMNSAMNGEMTMGITMPKSRTQAGWYTGAGINLGVMRFGVNYQSMLTRDGHYLVHEGKPLEINRVAHGFSFNVGVSF